MIISSFYRVLPQAPTPLEPILLSDGKLYRQIIGPNEKIIDFFELKNLQPGRLRVVEDPSVKAHIGKLQIDGPALYAYEYRNGQYIVGSFDVFSKNCLSVFESIKGNVEHPFAMLDLAEFSEKQDWIEYFHNTCLEKLSSSSNYLFEKLFGQKAPPNDTEEQSEEAVHRTIVLRSPTALMRCLRNYSVDINSSYLYKTIRESRVFSPENRISEISISDLDYFLTILLNKLRTLDNNTTLKFKIIESENKAFVSAAEYDNIKSASKLLKNSYISHLKLSTKENANDIYRIFNAQFSSPSRFMMLLLLSDVMSREEAFENYLAADNFDPPLAEAAEKTLRMMSVEQDSII